VEQENQGAKKSKSFRLTLEIAGPFPLQPALETPGSIENKGATPWDRSECLPAKKWRSIVHAFTSSIASSGGGGCPALAGQQLHTDAELYQIDFEWRRGDRHRFVAAERLWSFTFAFPHTRWDVNEPG